MVDYSKFSSAVSEVAGNNQTLSGVLGYTYDGAFHVVDPDDPRRFLVRFPNGNFVSALHRNLVPQKPGLPVLVGYDGIGRPVILGVDPTKIDSFLATTSGGASVGYHSHVRGSGMEFIIDPWMLKPLRVTVSSGTTLAVAAGWYAYGGVQVYYAGGTIDIAADITATAEFQNWVKVGINPVSGTLVATPGTATYGSSFAPPTADIGDIAFESLGYILLAAVWVNNGQTTLSSYQIEDLRYQPGLSTATASTLTEPLCLDGEILLLAGDVIMMGVP